MKITDKEIEKLARLYEKYESYREKLGRKLNKLCEFEADITFCEGDRHLILNVDSGHVAGLYLLDGASIKNKITEEEHSEGTF